MWRDANFGASVAVLTFAHVETLRFSQDRRHPFAENGHRPRPNLV